MKIVVVKFSTNNSSSELEITPLTIRDVPAILNCVKLKYY